MITDFIEWLNASDLLQSLSYGHKVVKYCNGYHVPIEAVKQNRSTSTIIQQCIEFWHEGRLSNQELEELSSDEVSNNDTIDEVDPNRC